MRALPGRHRTRGALVALAMGVPLVMSMPGAAVAHEEAADHPSFATTSDTPLSTNVNSGGRDAEWETITSVPTGNPQTDVDYFTQGGESYAAVGTLAVGANGGGQSIIKLTETDAAGEQEVNPAFLTSHPSAFCPSNASAALGLQHDVEATPKGEIINNSGLTSEPADAQLLLDATDAAGRCHDQGDLGLVGAPRGGLEIIDITDIENPVEIGLTSHTGQSHTVNIDPKRPHIAYSITSDQVAVGKDASDLDGDGDKEELIRQNEDTASAQRFNLDGFEVVDISSCMNFPEGTTVEQKREQCRPQVFRYRYESLDVALGHTNLETVFGCHESEIYANDKLTCGSGGAGIVFDMAGAFDDKGTPEFTDDTLKGAPLACTVRPSSTDPDLTDTGAMITDCVDGAGEGNDDLSVAKWLDAGAPSLDGVKRDGSIYHQGRDVTQPAIGEPNPATEDIDFNHEMEFTQSGDFLLATDERGGGVLGGAQCTAGNPADFTNGGVNAYQADELRLERPSGATAGERATEAYEAYARGTDGNKAIFRAPVRTGGEPTFCTAHVMQQVPDQNRIFMGWYTQGTQVIDYVELPDGRLEFVEDADAQEGSAATEDQPAVTPQVETEQAGFFIPENANQWVSHVFKAEENEDGSFTYFGAAGDFLLGRSGRNTVDFYKVTMPAPADACTLAPESTVSDREAAREVHRPSIDCALQYAIAKGTADGAYSPAANVTRGQMATFVLNAINAAGSGADLPAATGADEFSDLGSEPTHRASVNKLAELGIISGTGGGRFDPQATITRGQMATFVTQAARFVTGEEITPSQDSFTDEGATHAANINAGFERGYFSGTTAPTQDAQGTFSPGTVVQRDQMASFLTNLFTRTITQDELTGRDAL